ncbi:MAG: secretion system protein E [Planctomycetota bacterium]|nr:MAG: secretion system protein E [Planctomycetota bacterium]REK24765.1 MAG: secretion system protein E [Planctomycetota bacterium]REK37829.1 MAG: secretion system protein E [Planctomycetota bacterium]
MVFGFGKKRGPEPPDDDDEELELVLFQGALSGAETDLASNARLVQAGLVRAKELVSDALSRRAEMLRLEPKGKASIATFFVDGVPYPGTRMPSQAGLAVTQMLKLLAGLDIQVRDKPQKGGIKAEYEERPFVLRLNTFPVQGGGERLIVRAEEPDKRLQTPDDLGFSNDLRHKIRELAARKQGVLLGAGGPMSGVTTLTFAMVRSIDAYLYQIYCITDVEGRDLGNVSVFKTNEEDTLAQTFGRAERAEGDVLYIDPILDAETCKTVLQEAEEICFVAETRAPDAANAIVQFCKWTGNPKLVSEQVSGVASQKLIRLLCRRCRKAYRPNPKLLAKVGLPPETKVLYRPPQAEDIEDDEDVCSRCGGVGYFGRTGMIEFIEMTEDMRQVVAGGAAADAIKAQARTEKMQSFQSDGLRLVAEGKTSLEELQRAFRGK